MAGLTAVLALFVPGPSAGVTATATTLPLHRFPGLRSLFVIVRLDVESLLGDAGAVRGVLGTPGERDLLLRATPAASREQMAVAQALAVGRWAEYERVVVAVTGARAGRTRFPYAEVLAAFTEGAPLAVAAEEQALVRDRLVQRMAVLGYPPYLIADVVGGRIPLAALEQAIRLRLLGHGEAEVARYLEEQAEAQAAARARAAAEAAAASPAAPAVPPGAGPSRPTALADRTRRAVPASRPDRTPPEQYEAAIVRAAARHRVDPDLVRAVIRHESDWNPGARSPKGALGLMQLMPGTARLLGVDPLDPEQNIDGGTRYLASLLALFDGNLDAAILGYVGGPGYARNWLRGELVPSGEVRSYLEGVKRSYAGPLTAR